MANVVSRRLLETAVVLVIVTFISFSLLHITPGDPALYILGDNATPDRVQALRRELGLDEPIWVQYFEWASKLVQGELGTSIAYRESVGPLIASRLPITLHLGMTALLVSIMISLPAGVLCAVRRGGWLDSVITVTANLTHAVPTFWLGVLCIYIFSLKLNWLPVQGYTSPLENFWLGTQQLILPVACLAITTLPSLTRQIRSSMLEVIRQDYVRTAYSKGLSEQLVIVRHALRNALIPVVTLLGLQVRNLVGGSVLVETVFNVPGMGRLLVTSVFNKDFVVVQGVVLVVAIVVALANLIVDLSYSYLDPRIRVGE